MSTHHPRLQHISRICERNQSAAIAVKFRRRPAPAAALPLLVAIVIFTGPPTLQAQTVPTGFALEIVVHQPFVTFPVAFAFLPDGRILLLEKDSGNVRLAAVGSLTSSIIANIPGITGGGERGLLGVAVDPDWPARPYVYFHGTYEDSTIHITMQTASGDLNDPGSTNLSLGSPYVLLRDIRDFYNHHNGGTLRFGPDGYLYVSIGDEGAGCEATDRDFLGGKILRLDVSAMPGTGSGPPPKSAITPPDNPFSGPTDNARLVYAYGLRNPFRICIDPLSNDLVIGDVGELDWEEIDVAVHAGYAGDNYGWPAYEGLVARPCCGACLVEPAVAPVHVFPNPPDPATASVIGGPIYRRVQGSPSSFPFEYDGDLFFADHYGGWIRRLVRSGSDWIPAPPVPGQPNSLDWAKDIPFISDMQVGPDGGLYFLTMFTVSLDRGLHRIVDVGTTDAASSLATARLFAYPNPARAGSKITMVYRLPRAEAAWLRIFDASGRLVRSLHSLPEENIPWDGLDDAGLPVASGLYVYRLGTWSKELGRGKLTLVR